MRPRIDGVRQSYIYIEKSLPAVRLGWLAPARQLETALRQCMRQRLLWLKKEQEKVIVAFTQGHDVFVALPTGFGNSLCCCCLPYVFDKLRGFTNASIAVVVSPGGESWW